MCCSTETLEELLNYFHRSAIFYEYLELKGKPRLMIENILDKLKCEDKSCITHNLFTTYFKNKLLCNNCNKYGESEDVIK